MSSDAPKHSKEWWLAKAKLEEGHEAGVGGGAVSLPDWIEKLDEEGDAELEMVAHKIMHSQSPGDAYAVLDHYARRVCRTTARRLLSERGGLP